MVDRADLQWIELVKIQQEITPKITEAKGWLNNIDEYKRLQLADHFKKKFKDLAKEPDGAAVESRVPSGSGRERK